VDLGDVRDVAADADLGGRRRGALEDGTFCAGPAGRTYSHSISVEVTWPPPFRPPIAEKNGVSAGVSPYSMPV
jgi:hypothetical protein